MSPRHRRPEPPRSGPVHVLRERIGLWVAALSYRLRRVPLLHWRDLRRPRVLAGLGLVLTLLAGGTGIAVAASRAAMAPVQASDDRAAGNDRANRNYDRATESASPSASESPLPSVTASPSPIVTPTTPAPGKATPVAPTTQPVPKTTQPTPKATTATAVPAGCSAYQGNKLIACQLLPSFGFSTSEMSALVPMWTKESSWNELAENPSSGAYGIPQALPGTKMATVGSDWRTNPATQIKWGLGYIRDRYGSPSSAWAFWQSHGWY